MTDMCVNTHHESVVCPAAKLHHTLLLIKGEIFHINAAVWFVDGRGVPSHSASVVEYCLRHYRNLVIAVSTETNDHYYCQSDIVTKWQSDKVTRWHSDSVSVTCYRGRCLAARCPDWARGGTSHRRSPRGSRPACSLPTPAPPTRWWSVSASSCPAKPAVICY